MLKYWYEKESFRFGFDGYNDFSACLAHGVGGIRTAFVKHINIYVKHINI